MPRSLLTDRVAVAGIAASPMARSLPGSERSLAARTVSRALEDAGVSAAEVDGLVSYSMESTDAETLARDLGIGEVTFFTTVPYGGGAGCGTVMQAALAVATGHAKVAVAWRARKRGERSTAPWVNTASRVRGREALGRPFGLVRPVDEIAMLARRYMHEYDVTREHLANIALAFRRHANRNPLAQMHDRPLSRDEYLSARWVSEPLCLFDCCVESDGAAAVVLVSAERAADLRRPAVLVHSAAQGIADGGVTMMNYFAEDPLRGPSWTAARSLWEKSDLTPADIDVAQIYDVFTPLVLLSLEGYGFCPRGEGGAFTERRALEFDGGGLPVNTAGGSLSEGYLHGFNLIIEAVRQLRGDSTAQVPGAESCFVSSGEGVPTSALLLRSG